MTPIDTQTAISMLDAQTAGEGPEQQMVTDAMVALLEVGYIEAAVDSAAVLHMRSTPAAEAAEDWGAPL